MSSENGVASISVIVIVLFAGCADDPIPPLLSQPTSHPTPAQYPSTGIEFWDPPDIRNSPEIRDQITAEEETQAIAVAKAELAKDSDQPIMAQFAASRKQDGYRVFVQYYSGYDDQGRPLEVLGGHCLIIISEDWKVTRVIGGL